MGTFRKLGSDLFFNLGLKIRKNRKNKSDTNSRAPIFHFSGQSITEYVILIVIVSAVLLAMQSYMRMGIQGVIKVAADQAGKQDDSWEDVKDGTKTETAVTDISHGTTRARTMPGGSYRTDVNETSNNNLWYGHSESEQEY